MLNNLNTEFNKDFVFQPLAVEGRLKMTATVQIPGERGLFRKFPIKIVSRLDTILVQIWHQLDNGKRKPALLFLLSLTDKKGYWVQYPSVFRRTYGMNLRIGTPPGDQIHVLVVNRRHM